MGFSVDTLLCCLSLLACQTAGHRIIRNQTTGFRVSPDFDVITTYTETESFVYHMEPDLFVHGSILFSDGSALKTTDGTTTQTISGDSNTHYYHEAVGELARFSGMRSFRQIAPNKVVIVDTGNHCLRIIDRATLQTSRYAGHCGHIGFKDGIEEARFAHPYGVIDDVRRPGTLLVNDAMSRSIREIDTFVPAYLRNVSTFFSSFNNSEDPMSMAQVHGSGDLYIRGFTSVSRLIYSTKQLIPITLGSDKHSIDFCDFKVSDTGAIIIIADNKLLVTDSNIHSHQNLHILDMVTKTRSSFCPWVRQESSTAYKNCTFTAPHSLMVLNGKLYVGEYQSIRRVEDSLVSLCSDEYNKQILQVTSPSTGTALVDVPFLNGMGKLSLSSGSYPFHVTSEQASCTVDIKVKDHRLQRLLVLRSWYNVSCETNIGGVLAESPALQQIVKVTYDQLDDVCKPDCQRGEAAIELICEGNTLNVSWPTNITYDGATNKIPSDLERRLNQRITDQLTGLYLFLPGSTPPVVFPEMEDNGGFVKPILVNYCEGEELKYKEETDNCEK